MMVDSPHSGYPTASRGAPITLNHLMVSIIAFDKTEPR